MMGAAMAERMVGARAGAALGVDASASAGSAAAGRAKAVLPADAGAALGALARTAARLVRFPFGDGMIAFFCGLDVDDAEDFVMGDPQCREGARTIKGFFLEGDRAAGFRGTHDMRLDRSDTAAAEDKHIQNEILPRREQVPGRTHVQPASTYIVHLKRIKSSVRTFRPGDPYAHTFGDYTESGPMPRGLFLFRQAQGKIGKFCKIIGHYLDLTCRSSENSTRLFRA